MFLPNIFNFPTSTVQYYLYTIARPQHLDLSQNELESVPASVCELLALEWLNVSRNRIAELPAALSALSRLRTLLAAQNLIKALPDAICQLTELHTLVRGTACAPLTNSAHSGFTVFVFSTE